MAEMRGSRGVCWLPVVIGRTLKARERPSQVNPEMFQRAGIDPTNSIIREVRQKSLRTTEVIYEKP